VVRDRTLLERLARPDPVEQRTISEDRHRIVESLMRHLQKLLNTRQGQALIQPEYGLPDITDCVEGATEALDRVRKAIKSSIEMFEPRLQRVRITHVPIGHDLNLHFGISGQIVVDRERIPINFSTTVTPAGNALISVDQEFESTPAADTAHRDQRIGRATASSSRTR
jgi:type VI secretion system protein